MMPFVTLRSLVDYNDSLFDAARLPAGADRDTLVAWIIREYGEMQVTIPDWSALRFYSDNWFNAQFRSISRMWTAYMEDYNALWNKDGTVEETRTPDLVETRTPDLTDTRTPNLTNEMTHGKVSTESGDRTTQYEGFQSSSFQPVSKELPAAKVTNSGKDTATETGTDTTTHTGSDTTTHTGTEKIVRRDFGNIGLTTSQSMLTDEIKLWSNFNWYSVVAEMWARDFCVMIY